MTLTIRYLLSNGAGDTVTLHNVQTITQTGAMDYAVSCFGNDAVTWRRVTALSLAVDAPTALPAKPAPAKPATPKPAKINLCYKCQMPFTFRRSGSLLERIDIATGKPHECQGRAASAIVVG
jgi:hypothetical protein